MRPDDIAAFLDDYLHAAAWADTDDATRFEVAGDRPVATVACAVDACLAVIREASGRGADLLLVRNGLGLGRPLAGQHRDKVAAALRSGLSVYVAGGALDAHAEAGGGANLLKSIGLAPERAFGRAGLAAACDLSRDELVARVEATCGRAQVLPAGPTRIVRVGVVAGRCVDVAADATAARLDALVTGETSHAQAVEAEDHAVNLVLAGYHATEALGVRALAEIVARRFGLESFFVAHTAGL